MNRDEALRLRGSCSVWGCEEPTFAESLCSQHYAPHFAPRAPGPEAIRSVHRPRKTRRPPGRTAAGPPLNNSQWSAYSARHSDSTFSFTEKAMPTSFTHHSQHHQEPNHMPPHPPFGFGEPPMQRQKRGIAEVIEVNASTITVETMPPRPREPYFVLNPEFTSIDQRRSPYTRPQPNQDFSQSRHVPPSTIPRRNLDPVGGYAGAGVELPSNLNFTHAQPSTLPSNMPSATHKNPPPPTVPSTRVEDARVDDPSTITVAPAPSRRKSESGRTHKREGSTIHVAQPFKENLPLHISPKKRKADSSDTQLKGREPSTKQRPEGSFTPPASERERESRLSSQPGEGYQTVPSNSSSKNQSRRSSASDNQATTQLRNSNRAQAPTKLMPMIEVALAKANEQLENHTVFIQDDVGEQNPTPTSPQLQQPEPQANGLNDERESVVTTPPSALEIDAPVEHDTITVATQNIAATIMAEVITPVEPRTAEEPRTPRTPRMPRVPRAHIFDSEAFDNMIYRQSTLRPPPGVSVQAPPRPKTPVQPSSIEDRGQFLAINPAIHYPYKRSEEWYKEKALAIQARRGRKAWFGKVIERRRWLRAKEKAEDERNAATQKPTRIDPQPWSYDRIIDFGDVPEEELPDDVLQNPAWVKACAWHRENQAKRVFRERAARDAIGEAWSQAERIMEDAKLASQRSRQK